MKRTRTAVEALALLCWAAGSVALYALTVAGGLLATAILLGAVSYVLGGPA